MTGHDDREFEERVLEALRTIKYGAGTDGMMELPLDDDHLRPIARRVAAAIQAGRGASEIGPETYEPMALAALRGNVA